MNDRDFATFAARQGRYVDSPRPMALPAERREDDRLVIESGPNLRRIQAEHRREVFELEVERFSLPPDMESVLLAIASFANAEACHAFPSDEEIADVSGCSMPTVRRCIERAVSDGWLRAIPCLYRDGTQATDAFGFEIPDDVIDVWNDPDAVVPAYRMDI